MRHRRSAPVLLLIVMISLLSACQTDDATDADSPMTVFHSISVIPMASPGILENQTVVIENGRIRDLGPAEDVEVPSGADVVDGQGRFLIPGLAEMHGHPMTDDDLMLYLANGITWMRALWGEPSLLELRDRVEKGLTPGPSLYVGGRIVDGPVPIHYATEALSDPADAATLVRQQQDAGYDFVKIYSGLSLEVFDAIDEASQQSGFPYAGHIPIAVPLDRVLQSQMRTSEHMYGYLAAVQADSVPVNLDATFADPRARAYVERIGRGEIAPESLVDPAKVEALAARVAESGLSLVPTLVVHEAILRLGAESPPEARYQNVGTQHMWRNAGAMMTSFSAPDLAAGNQQLFELQKKLIGDLHAAGATILVGTDAPNPNVTSGFAVASELELLVDAGMTREEALRAATLGAAEFAGDAAERGHITVGAIADLVVLDGNPLADFEALRDPVGVMHDGRWYDREMLQAQLERIAASNSGLEQRFDEAPQLEGPAFTRMDFLTEDGRQLAMTTSLSAPSPGSEGSPALSVDAALRNEPDGPWQGFELTRDASGQTLTLSNESEASFRLDASDDQVRLSKDGQVVREEAGSDSVVLLLTGTEADLSLASGLLAALNVGDDLAVQAWRCGDPWSEAMLSCDQPQVEEWTVSRRPNRVIDGHFYYTGSRVFEIARTADSSRVGTWFIGGGAYEGQPVRRVDAAADRQPLRRAR